MQYKNLVHGQFLRQVNFQILFAVAKELLAITIQQNQNIKKEQ